MNQEARLTKAREIQEAIGTILLQDWDPLGVRDVGEAQDEYEHYIGGVYRLLASGASPEVLVEHLAQVEAASMGLSQGRRTDLRVVAEKLCALAVGLQEN